MLPEKAHEPQLTEDADHFCCALLSNNDAVVSGSEYLYRARKGIGVLEEGRGFFPAEKVFDV